MGYGDSAINFTLFAWPDHFHHWLQVKSDLTTAVYEAVSAAGDELSVSQREVRVRREAEVPQARETSRRPLEGEPQREGGNVKTVGMTPPARGELRCERLADDTLLVHLVGHWTIRAGAPVVTDVYQQLDASPRCGGWPSRPRT